MDKLGRIVFYVGCGLTAIALSFLLYGCNAESVTGPSPEPAVATVQPAPQPVAETAPAAPVTGGGPGPTSVVCTKGGVCTFSNTGQAPKKVESFCTVPGDTAPVYGYFLFYVPIGQDTLVKTAEELCGEGITPSCGPTERRVQLDFNAGGGEHIGHWGGVLKYEANERDTEPVITYGEPGEFGKCAEGDPPLLTQSCVEPSCDLPNEGVYPFSPGGPNAECAAFGNYVSNDKDEYWPFNMDDADFYLIKAGQFVKLVYSKPNPYATHVYVDKFRGISHITACVCGKEQCEPELVTQCRYRDVYQQFCDGKPETIGSEFVDSRVVDLNHCEVD